MRSLLIFFLFSLFGQVWADYEHEPIRTLAVFPFSFGETHKKWAEEAWWIARETLSESGRFLVASKQFLMQKDVFQARGLLDPADAIVISKHIDAHALLTTELEGRELKMRAYEGRFGRILWEQKIQINSSLTLKEQLSSLVRRLVYDFLVSVPYQGSLVRNIEDKVVYVENNRFLVRAHFGRVPPPVGAKIQVIRIFHETIRPLFSIETDIEVIADGKVITIEDEFAILELVRFSPDLQFKEGMLVKAPDQWAEAQEQHKIKLEPGLKVGREFLSPQVSPVSERLRESKPLFFSLAFLANLATFLLLAF